VLQVQLQELVTLVQGQLSKKSRLTLGALIVLDMHAKDIVEDLVKSRVHSESDFKWLSQLRYIIWLYMYNWL
jgi:dynein heavy chain